MGSTPAVTREVGGPRLAGQDVAHLSLPPSRGADSAHAAARTSDPRASAVPRGPGLWAPRRRWGKGTGLSRGVA